MVTSIRWQYITILFTTPTHLPIRKFSLEKFHGMALQIATEIKISAYKFLMFWFIVRERHSKLGKNGKNVAVRE